MGIVYQRFAAMPYDFEQPCGKLDPALRRPPASFPEGQAELISKILALAAGLF